MAGDTFTDEIPNMTAFLRRPTEGTEMELREPARKAEASPATGVEAPSRLPHRIPGGLKGVSEDLERHAREWRHTYRLMEQQRPLMDAVETERERLHEALGRLVPRVHDNGRSLTSAMEMAKKGDFSGDLSGQFTRSLAALDELESLSEALAANLLQMRSTWEQYARTVIRAQKLRDGLKPELTGDR